MVKVLIKLFIKDSDNVASASVRQSYGIVCGIVGIILNIFLFICKLFAGVVSGSIAIMADAFNNLSDAGSSVILLVGFKMAGQKPDEKHPFGHGRIEYLSGLFVSIAILIMGFELTKTSINKIIHPQEIEFSLIVIVILIGSICVKCYMAFYNSRIGKKIDSSAMSATAKDSLSDMLSTLVVLISTLVCKFAGINIDGYCGVVVGIFILFTGFSAIKETSDPLLGQAPDPEFVDKTKNIVLESNSIIGIHDLVVHNYGPGRIMISLHAEVSADADLIATHDEIDNIEKKLNRELCCESIIHMDPIFVNDEETNKLKKKIHAIISEMDESMTFHDLRIVKGPTHTNIIFDIVIPYNCTMTESEIKNTIDGKLECEKNSYFTVICMDKYYL